MSNLTAIEKTIPEDVMKIVRRLQEENIVPDINELVPNDSDKTFEMLTKTIKECIESDWNNSG
ncbi:MAG: hypothetical protein A2015_09495 [Spirochaetes bacterium GWF1_31_7]|nr:MAG: hypothetical protein A2Y30_01185 [Spirochaetes bacterium GWE1_32_154]OHD45086.1 MAG: hypothetical protein A2Y29_15230 [Spirochaetes bacterium GWE2_31_10]OHD52653.1 MAG: hypothetical protein A2015_09495 [Spirochaetes bacterium GWF1_31_7]OHD72697.1 MAG: hypothetical protein A2355_05835 [Spirochaetes bacterium RIFOXYB1_FULL_32_8]HBD95239.1 hypothetical protein [Spirochaetia bacterium]